MEQKARRASRWVQRALRERKIATQTALEEEEAKRRFHLIVMLLLGWLDKRCIWLFFNYWLVGPRWPQEISGPNYGDMTLLATYKWLVDVKGVQVGDENSVLFAHLGDLHDNFNTYIHPCGQADKAVLVTGDVLVDVAARREQMRVCDVQYLKSKISDWITLNWFCCTRTRIYICTVRVSNVFMYKCSYQIARICMNCKILPLLSCSICRFWDIYCQKSRIL